MTYTTNYNPNPSFQLGSEGYSALNGSTITLDSANTLFGPQSLFVSCPGDVAGEGVITASGTIPDNSIGAASLYITGVGTVLVQAIQNPGGIIAASTTVMCSNQWTRVALSGIECTPGQSLFLIVETVAAEQAQFWISGVQIEDTSPAHPYVDGDQSGGVWLSYPIRGGVSNQPVQNPIVTSSGSRSGGRPVNVLIEGEAFYIGPTTVSSDKNYNPLVQIGNAGPVGAITDFSIAELNDPDPAQTYTSWNNAGSTAATGNNWTRIWGIFNPPLDYLVSNGTSLYKRAAYMAAGWWFESVPNNGTVNVTTTQVEILPITTGFSAQAPTSWVPPRAINTIVLPNRLNYCTNPSIEVNTTGWTATGTATIAQDPTVYVSQSIVEYDDQVYVAGYNSLNVTVHNPGDGAEITINDLLTGYTYIASVYVQSGQGLANILMTISNGETSVLSVGGTQFDTGTYAGGYYGGINPTQDLPQSTWYRLNCIFTATSDSHTLEITADPSADVSYPTHLWIDAVLVEEGELLSNYFDGSFGTNFSWESTAGLSRSYYYDQYSIKTQAVTNILGKHTPLGISYTSPQYNTPPIQ